MMAAYVGRHRLRTPSRHRRIVDHVVDGWPCVKTRFGLAGFVLLLAVVAAQFGAVKVVAPDPGLVAFVSADAPVYGPAVETGCWR